MEQFVRRKYNFFFRFFILRDISSKLISVNTIRKFYPRLYSRWNSFICSSLCVRFLCIHYYFLLLSYSPLRVSFVLCVIANRLCSVKVIEKEERKQRLAFTHIDWILIFRANILCLSEVP